MKKSINDFKVEKLENRKEFTFYFICNPTPPVCNPGGGNPNPNPNPVPNP